MTQRQKFDANERREYLFECADWISVVSGNPLRTGVPQLAHRVARTKSALETWGSDVIDHPLNLVPVRSLSENDACNIGNQKIKAKALLERIVRIQTGGESMPDLREHYSDLRAEFQERRKT